MIPQIGHKGISLPICVWSLSLCSGCSRFDLVDLVPKLRLGTARWIAPRRSTQYVNSFNSNGLGKEERDLEE